MRLSQATPLFYVYLTVGSGRVFRTKGLIAMTRWSTKMPITHLCRVQGASLSEHVEPLRLLLLAEDPSWEALVRKCLLPMGGSVILLRAKLGVRQLPV